MKTTLLAASFLGFTLFASAPADAASISVPANGTLRASAGTTNPCAWNVDGIMVGVSSELDVALFAGEHTLKCKRLVDGALSTQVVRIVSHQTTEVVAALPTMKGEIIAVAIGGTCTFAINGAVKNTSAQHRSWVLPGTYAISCKDKNGAQKTRSVIVKSGETAMAMFKLE